MTYETIKARMGAVKKLERILLRPLTDEEKDYVIEHGIHDFMSKYLNMSADDWEHLFNVQAFITEYFIDSEKACKNDSVIPTVVNVLKRILADLTPAVSSVRIGRQEDLGTQIRYPEDSKQCTEDELVKGCQFNPEPDSDTDIMKRIQQGEVFTVPVEKAFQLYPGLLKLAETDSSIKGVGIFADNDDAIISLLK